MSRLHLFRGGTQTAMSGLSRAYDVAAIASTYDPALHEAPLVLGHPTHDAPAAGWVASLSADGNELFGEPAQVDPVFAEAVEQGRYKKISASFYLEDSPHHPIRVAGGTPSAPYLRHVGFLGAQVPAIKGLEPVEFAEGEEGVATVEFSEADFSETAWTVRGLLRSMRRLRDYIAGRDGEETAEAVLPSADLDYALEDVARQEGREQGLQEAALDTDKERIGALSPVFSETDSAEPTVPPDTIMDKTPEELLAEREAQFAERERQLAERESTIHAQEAAAIRQANADFAESLAGDGARILPAHVGIVASVLDQLTGVAADGATVEFGEGDGAEQVAPAEALRRMLTELPPTVDFGERSAPVAEGEAAATAEFASAPGFDVDVEQLAVHNKALAYQKANPGTDYVAAVQAVR